MNKNVLCDHSKSILVDPVTTSEGKTYSLHVCTSHLLKCHTQLIKLHDTLYNNIAARKRAEKAIEALQTQWTPNYLREKGVEERAEMAVVCCNEGLVTRLLDSVSSRSDDKGDGEDGENGESRAKFIAHLIKLARKRGNILLFTKMGCMRTHICWHCGNQIGITTSTSDHHEFMIDGKTCHMQCALKLSMESVHTRLTFMRGVRRDGRVPENMDHLKLLESSGFICLESMSKKRPKWLHEIIRCVKHAAGTDDDADVWVLPSTCSFVITNDRRDRMKDVWPHRQVWVIPIEEDLELFYSETWNLRSKLSILIWPLKNEHVRTEATQVMSILRQKSDKDIIPFLKLT